MTESPEVVRPAVGGGSGRLVASGTTRAAGRFLTAAVERSERKRSSAGGIGARSRFAVDPIFRETEIGEIISRKAGMTPGHGFEK